MKLHIQIEQVKETVEVRDAAEALSRFKKEAAKRAPFLKRAVINAMSDMTFAAEAVKMGNGRSGRQDAAPKNAQEFLDWAVARGFVTIDDK